MTPEQATAAAALHAAAFAGIGRAWSAEEIRDLVRRPGALWRLEADAMLIGHAAAGEAELLTLATRPGARRRGAARRLLSAFLAEAGAAGAQAAFLEVAEDNAPARALYRAAGFQEVGRRPAYYRRPDGGRQDALVLRRCPVFGANNHPVESVRIDLTKPNADTRD